MQYAGLALRANVPLGITLSAGLFKALAGKKAVLQDLTEMDGQVGRWMGRWASRAGCGARVLSAVQLRA